MGVNTADVVDRQIDKTGVITEMSSCPQISEDVETAASAQG